jgi:RNA 2',3'-cyclic 3'-phosphodiesterase
MRAFVAIELAPDIKSALADLIRRLKRIDRGGIGWVREEGMHLTLKFLGEIEESRIASVGAAMDEAAAPAEPFLLEVRGTGYFPSARAPRVLWAGLSPAPGLDALQARLESALESLGFERESRPFHPHLTLGRVRSAAGIRDILTELDLRKHASFGTMTAAKIALVQSVLKPGGAEYSVRKESLFP